MLNSVRWCRLTVPAELPNRCNGTEEGLSGSPLLSFEMCVSGVADDKGRAAT